MKVQNCFDHGVIAKPNSDPKVFGVITKKGEHKECVHCKKVHGGPSCWVKDGEKCDDCGKARPTGFYYCSKRRKASLIRKESFLKRRKKSADIVHCLLCTSGSLHLVSLINTTLSRVKGD